MKNNYYVKFCAFLDDQKGCFCRATLIGCLSIFLLSSSSHAADNFHNRIQLSFLIHAIVENNRSFKFSFIKNFDYRLLDWIAGNITSDTKMPLSFSVAEESKNYIFERMGDMDSVEGVIERVIVEEGLVIYDGAVAQIALTMSAREDYLEQAYKPIEVYWNGKLEENLNIRAGYPVNNFIYDPEQPELVSSDLENKGKRGFIFRIINAHGKYNTSDPLDGKKVMESFPNFPTVHWEDWKPVAGENAWVVMVALHIYHKKYFDVLLQKYAHPENAIELELAKELARAAIILQTDNGGIRMAPKGTFRNERDFVSPEQKQGDWWYEQIASENNLSWYSAFRMLHEITGDEQYLQAMLGIEKFFKLVWNNEFNYFYQGVFYYDGQWHFNSDHFALDVQTWGILTFGPEKIDSWFGEGSAAQMWEISKTFSGYWLANKEIAGVGYTQEHDWLSVEWTAGAIMATRELAKYYDKNGQQDLAKSAAIDAAMMRKNIDMLRHDVGEYHAAYSYSSRRGWIPFGWYSHDPEVLSITSTGWMIFVDANFNPFRLPDEFYALKYSRSIVSK